MQNAVVGLAVGGLVVGLCGVALGLVPIIQPNGEPSPSSQWEHIASRSEPDLGGGLQSNA